MERYVRKIAWEMLLFPWRIHLPEASPTTANVFSFSTHEVWKEMLPFTRVDTILFVVVDTILNLYPQTEVWVLPCFEGKWGQKLSSGIPETEAIPRPPLVMDHLSETFCYARSLPCPTRPFKSTQRVAYMQTLSFMVMRIPWGVLGGRPGGQGRTLDKDLQQVLKDKCKLASKRRVLGGEDRMMKATKEWELPASLGSISTCFLRMCKWLSSFCFSLSMKQCVVVCSRWQCFLTLGCLQEWSPSMLLRDHTPSQLMPVGAWEGTLFPATSLTGVPRECCCAIFMIHFLAVDGPLAKSLSTELRTGVGCPRPGEVAGLNLRASQNLIRGRGWNG